MPSYSINNTVGNLIATIPVGQINNSALPITLIGQGVSLYGEYIQENMVKLLENFASPTEPANPVDGMLWFFNVVGQRRLLIRVGTDWFPVGTGFTMSSIMLPRQSTANSINFATTATYEISLNTTPNYRFCPSAVMLTPVGTPTATTAAAFNLYIDTAEDVMEQTIVNNYAANKFSVFQIEGTTRYAANGESIKLQVTTAASGGSLVFNAYVFGMINRVT